jgi:hypothetical protein
VSTTTRHFSLSSAKLIQSKPSHPFSLICILILFSDLCLGLVHSSVNTKTPYAFLFSPIRITRPAHLNLLDFIIRISVEEYRPCSSLLCSTPSWQFLTLRPKYLPHHRYQTSSAYVLPITWQATFQVHIRQAGRNNVYTVQRNTNSVQRENIWERQLYQA